jgi:cation diffusion facilitator CzcD-associated flavoprotein CzcO
MDRPPIGLAAHEAALARDLRLLNLPPKPRVHPRLAADGAPVTDVVIVGGGLCGLCAAAAVKFLGISNLLVLDRAPAGREGPWVTFARMRTLRTEKNIAGPALGIPALTPRAWFEAQYGEAAWEAMDRIPRAMWMEYMIWYRRVLDLPVRNEVDVIAIVPRDDGLIFIRTRTEALLARRVVLATGADGLGAPTLPPIAKAVSRRFWAHSSDMIDFSKLAGKRVGVVGAGASAMDNAATALEAGAASVDMLIRKPEIPRVDRLGAIASKGTVHGFFDLPMERKWRYFRAAMESSLPPPRHSVQRVAAHPNARFHFSSPIVELFEEGGALRAVTPRREHRLDFLIFGTGFGIDFSARPELSAIAPHIRRWRDSFVPPPGQAHAGLAEFPDIGPGFEFRERNPGACPALRNISTFNFPTVLSHGKINSGIPSISDGAQRLARAIARGLYVEGADADYAAFLEWDKSELRGDECVDADAISLPA